VTTPGDHGAAPATSDPTALPAGELDVDVVVPTVGRPSLGVLLAALDRDPGPRPRSIVLVDDRGAAADVAELLAAVPTGLRPLVRIAAGSGAGPASARNAGWRQGTAAWVAFLDDDVVPTRGWWSDLDADLAAAGPGVGGTQGRLVVPLPADRRPTDWERNVAGLETARWATADLAYRRPVLEQVDGFDERFPRAYREDADLGLRVTSAGWRILDGRRTIHHPVRPAPWHVSVGKQAGNADDALMRRLHGPHWRARAGAPRGTLRRHVATTAAAAVALAAAATGRRRVAAFAAIGWAAATGDLARRRIAGGPNTPAEVSAMVATSVALPVAACWWRLRGELAHLGTPPAEPVRALRAVLFDRDGTLVHDVPYNGDPERVVPVAGATEAVARLRAAGVAVGLVTNQSGVARGLVDERSVDAVNGRVAELVGGFDSVRVCLHGPDDGCACRKPAPGMVLDAAAELGVPPDAVAVVGDIGADVDAAEAAGARGVLVPTPRTRPDEVARAAQTAPDVTAAVDLLLRTSRVPG
jgi:histidinol-phosphate phosphatase family protein